MKRPTIADLAQASGVSIATVNRILGGTGAVRAETIERVQNAAEEIGFYGRGVIEDRRQRLLPNYRFGFLLQQSSRELYRLFGSKITEAAARRQHEKVVAVVDFVDVLEPQNIADRLEALGKRCDAVAVIAGDHPLIGQTIQSLKERGKPVVAYITDQSARDRAGFVGTDNWKLGRTAAWFLAQTTPMPGRIAVFIGNHRYQCQDVSDASFRSYMREHAPHLQVDDSRPTHEEPQEAYRIVSQLLSELDDLRGIFIVGGGFPVCCALFAKRRSAGQGQGRLPRHRPGNAQGLNGRPDHGGIVPSAGSDIGRIDRDDDRRAGTPRQYNNPSARGSLRNDYARKRLNRPVCIGRLAGKAIRPIKWQG